MAEKKEIFRKPISQRKIIETPTGEKVTEEWAMRLDENGKEEFYIKGYTNTYEKIQAYKDECLIENILTQCMDTGDMSILERTKATYMDISEMPSNIYEAHKQIETAKAEFMNLPLEIRTKYNNNFNEFMKDFGTENWRKNLQIENKKEEVKKEVKETTKEKADE